MSLRPISIQQGLQIFPSGSVLISVGNTIVLCAVSIEQGVPSFLKEAGQGWLTAEYSMLPSSTPQRNRRESTAGKISGRTAEIQRLIGRSLRAVVDLTKIPNLTVHVDCDVIQADGGTRTTSINGASVALYSAFNSLLQAGIIEESPMKELVAAISVGISGEQFMLDLDYEKDSQAGVDMNVVMTASGRLIEVQGTAENQLFTREELNRLLDLAESGIQQIVAVQREALGIS